MKKNTYYVHFTHPNVDVRTEAKVTGQNGPKQAEIPVEKFPDPLIRLLVAAIGPARIYKVEHKDCTGREVLWVDLLLVLSQKCIIPFAELEPILQIGSLKDPKVTCSLHQEHTVADGLKCGHVFYLRFMTEEHLVYDDGSICFPQTDQGLRDALNERLRNQFTFFREKARCFYESAVSLYDNYTPPVIVFMLHQAVELTYRGILENLNGYGKKTHDTRTLRKQTRRCAPQLGTIFPDDTPEEQRLVSLLDNAYSASRYDSRFTISDRDIRTLIERIRLFMETADMVFEHSLLKG